MDQFNFDSFPSTNFNETNLDWLLSLVQHLTELVESGRYGVPAGGSTGQVLGKLGPDDFQTGWIDQTGGGTSNYTQLTNKPQINGVELLGNKTAAQLNLVAAQAGMGLSQNSFTNEEKAVLDSLYFVDQSNTYAELETAYAAGKKILFFEDGELFPILLHPNNQFWFLHPILNGGMRSVSITTTQNWVFRTEVNPLSAVRFAAQTLTEAQKQQARENIGAVSTGDYNPDKKTAAMTQAVGKDSSGKLWTAPGGGSAGASGFRLIKHIVADAAANAVDITTDENGDPFSIENECYIYVHHPKAETGTTIASFATLKFNNKNAASYTSFAIVPSATYWRVCLHHSVNLGSGSVLENFGNRDNVNMIAAGQNYIFGAASDYYPITRISWSGENVVLEGSEIYVFGR